MACASDDRDQSLRDTFAIELLERERASDWRSVADEQREREDSERVDVGGDAVIRPRQAFGREVRGVVEIRLALGVAELEPMRRDQDLSVVGDDDVLGAEIAEDERVLTMRVRNGAGELADDVRDQLEGERIVATR